MIKEMITNLYQDYKHFKQVYFFFLTVHIYNCHNKYKQYKV